MYILIFGPRRKFHFFTQFCYILQGLLFIVQTDIFYCHKLYPNDDLNTLLTNFVKKILNLFGVKKQMMELVCIDEMSDRIEDLISKCITKSRIDTSANNFNPMLFFFFHPFFVSEVTNL